MALFVVPEKTMSTKHIDPTFSSGHPLSPGTIAWMKEHTPDAYQSLVDELIETKQGLNILLEAIDAGVPVDIGSKGRRALFESEWSVETFERMAQQVAKDKGKDPFETAIVALASNDPGMFYGLLSSMGPLDELVSHEPFKKFIEPPNFSGAINPGAQLAMSRLAIITAALDKKQTNPKAFINILTRVLQTKGMPDPFSLTVRIDLSGRIEDYTLFDLALRQSSLLSAMRNTGIDSAPKGDVLGQYQESLRRYLGETMGDKSLPADTRKKLGMALTEMAAIHIFPAQSDLDKHITCKIKIHSSSVGMSFRECFPVCERELKIPVFDHTHHGEVGHSTSPLHIIPLPMTLLGFAVHQGNKIAVANLLNQGHDVNASNTYNGVTPLHIAAAAGDLHMFSTLVDAGANPAATDIKGRMPLDWAGLTNAGLKQESAMRALVDSHAAKKSIMKIIKSVVPAPT